jgi:DNA-binding MarR family transcriptional regulator
MKTEAILNLGFVSGLDNTLKRYKKHIQSGLIKHGIDITLDQWQVLDVIVNNKDIKQTEIA